MPEVEPSTTTKSYVQNVTTSSRIKKNIEIVSGAYYRGADKLGEQYAKERGYKITRFPADRKRFGRAAGPKRNEQMANYADALIAFWDEKSRGTKNMIDLAKIKNLIILIKN